jgi:hypothetical protein
MFRIRTYIFVGIWIISILISIIWTFENSDKVQSLKDRLKKNKAKIENIGKDKEINSAYYLLNLKEFKVPVWSKYGAIASLNNKIIYVSGDSEFFLLEESKSKYKFKSLEINKVDNNKEAFIRINNPKIGKNAEEYFTVKDVLIERFSISQKKILLLSSLNYIESEDCYNMSVYLSEIINEKTVKISDWKNIFSSQKCLSINLTKKPRFAAASAGGRIIKFDNENILLSIGDFYADGVNGPNLSQDLENDYGKIIKININNKDHEIFSYGHRNPQGLYIDKEMNIFSSEHGPRGGDEINLIKKNNNYGWPYATFGTNYLSYNAYDKDSTIEENKSKRVWPIDKTNNTHDGYTKPIYSWGNPFGASNLIVYENKYFNKWSNNLIVSSLAKKQLTRMVYDYENNAVIYVENIPVDERVRDIISLKNGKLALLTDRGVNKKDNPKIILISQLK